MTVQQTTIILAVALALTSPTIALAAKGSCEGAFQPDQEKSRKEVFYPSFRRPIAAPLPCWLKPDQEKCVDGRDSIVRLPRAKSEKNP